MWPEHLVRCLENVSAYKNDHWKDALYNLGYALGEFIYIMDAYDDLEKDEAKNEYNPLSL